MISGKLRSWWLSLLSTSAWAAPAFSLPLLLPRALGDEAHSQRRARALQYFNLQHPREVLKLPPPAKSPTYRGRPAAPGALRRPCLPPPPPLPRYSYSSPRWPVEQVVRSGIKGGQGASRQLRGQYATAGYCAYNRLHGEAPRGLLYRPCLTPRSVSQSERSRFMVFPPS
jgi:hypothetical protein